MEKVKSKSKKIISVSLILIVLTAITLVINIFTGNWVYNLIGATIGIFLLVVAPKYTEKIHNKISNVKVSKHFFIFLIVGVLLMGIMVMAISYTDTGVRDSNGTLISSRTVDVVVCRGTSLADDIVKSFQCDVVCKSTDDDCGDDINRAITTSKQGGVVQLYGTNFTITSTIQMKYGITLKGQRGTTLASNPTQFSYQTFTRLKWRGSSDGIILNISGAIFNFGITDLVFDGSYMAKYGIFKIADGVNKAKSLQLDRLTFANINGTSIYLGNMVDDTTLNDIYIQAGGNNSIGVQMPNTQVKFNGGSIYEQQIAGVLIDGSDTAGISFSGVVFGSNANDMIINVSKSYLLPISFFNCWFEPGSGRDNLILLTNTTEIYGIDFYGCNIGADGTRKSIINMSLATGGEVSFFGGRSYIPIGTNASIIGNGAATTNFSVNFYNHYQADKYNLTNTAYSIYGNNQTIYSGSKSGIDLVKGTSVASIYNDGSLNIKSPADVFSTAGTFYHTGHLRIFGSGNITIDNAAGAGTGFACLDTNGKIFRKATACA